MFFFLKGLDPAALRFEHFSIAVKLDPSDAAFVDVIHTNAGGRFAAKHLY